VEVVEHQVRQVHQELQVQVEVAVHQVHQELLVQVEVVERAERVV
jgi:hypothetical protein